MTASWRLVRRAREAHLVVCACGFTRWRWAALGDLLVRADVLHGMKASFALVCVRFSSVACRPQPRAIIGTPWPEKDCAPIHGGVSGARPSALISASSRHRHERLLSRGRGELVVRTYSSVDTQPIPDVSLALRSTFPMRIAAQTDDAGSATLELSAGRHELTARHVGFATRSDSVEVRLGRRDSVFLGLGKPPFCLTQ